MSAEYFKNRRAEMAVTPSNHSGAGIPIADAEKLPTNDSCKVFGDSPGIRSILKAVIVRLALRGMLPAFFAEWLIRHGGLRHA